MWRNGRRRGLKIPGPARVVRVRSPPSAVFFLRPASKIPAAALVRTLCAQRHHRGRERRCALNQALRLRRLREQESRPNRNCSEQWPGATSAQAAAVARRSSVLAPENGCDGRGTLFLSLDHRWPPCAGRPRPDVPSRQGRDVDGAPRPHRQMTMLAHELARTEIRRIPQHDPRTVQTLRTGRW